MLIEPAYVNMTTIMITNQINVYIEERYSCFSFIALIFV